MADSEVRIRHIFFKPNSSHLQFKAEKKEGEVLNKPGAYTSPACDSDSSMAAKTACTRCSMCTNACVQNSFQLHLTARPAQYDCGYEHMPEVGPHFHTHTGCSGPPL